MSHAVQPDKPNIPSSAAFWAVLIFVGLLVGAINFVKAMSSDEGHGGGHGAATEHHDAAAGGHGDSHAAPAQGHGHEAAPAEGHDSHAAPAEAHAAPHAEEKAKEEAHH